MSLSPEVWIDFIAVAIYCFMVILNKSRKALTLHFGNCRPKD